MGFQVSNGFRSRCEDLYLLMFFLPQRLRPQRFTTSTPQCLMAPLHSGWLPQIWSDMNIQTFFSWTLIHNRQINLPLGIFLHYKNALALLQVVQGNQRKLAPLCAKDRFRETRPRCEGDVDWGHRKHPFDLSKNYVGWQTHSRVHALDVSILFVQ